MFSQTLFNISTTPVTLNNSLEKFLTKTDIMGRQNTYKIAYREYIQIDKGLTALNTLIYTTAGPNYQDFINNITSPYTILKLLVNIAKLFNTQLRQTLNNKLN